MMLAECETADRYFPGYVRKLCLIEARSGLYTALDRSALWGIGRARPDQPQPTSRRVIYE